MEEFSFDATQKTVSKVWVQHTLYELNLDRLYLVTMRCRKIHLANCLLWNVSVCVPLPCFCGEMREEFCLTFNVPGSTNCIILPVFATVVCVFAFGLKQFERQYALQCGVGTTVCSSFQSSLQNNAHTIRNRNWDVITWWLLCNWILAQFARLNIWKWKFGVTLARFREQLYFGHILLETLSDQFWPQSITVHDFINDSRGLLTSPWVCIAYNRDKSSNCVSFVSVSREITHTCSFKMVVVRSVPVKASFSCQDSN